MSFKSGKFPVMPTMAVLIALSYAIVLCACSPDNYIQNNENIPEKSTNSTSKIVTKEIQTTIIIRGPSDHTGGVSELVIVPREIVISTGEKTRLYVEAIDDGGQAAEKFDLIWSIVDPRVGNIEADGNFTAGDYPGFYENSIAATAILELPQGPEYIQETANVSILSKQSKRSLSELELYPANPTILSGQYYQLRAVALDQKGLPIPNVPIRWESADSTLATISKTGYLSTDAAPDLYKNLIKVTAEWDGEKTEKTADLTIVESNLQGPELSVYIIPNKLYVTTNEKVKLRAVVINGRGSVDQHSQIRWTMSDLEAGEITGDGLFSPNGNTGTFHNAVTVEAMISKSGKIVKAHDQATVIVKRPPEPTKLSGARILQKDPVLAPGSHTIFLAKAHDSSGTTISNIDFSWEMRTEDAGTISPEGVFQAGDKPGIFDHAIKVVASQSLNGEFITSFDTVGINIPGEMYSSEFQPHLSVLRPGESRRLNVVTTDSNGIKISSLETNWDVLDSKAGSIDSMGNFVAGSTPGTYENAVRATIKQTIDRN